MYSTAFCSRYHCVDACCGIYFFSVGVQTFHSSSFQGNESWHHVKDSFSWHHLYVGAGYSVVFSYCQGYRKSKLCPCVRYITVAFGYVFASVVKYRGLVAIRSLIVPLVSVECACVNLQITQCVFSVSRCCVSRPPRMKLPHIDWLLLHTNTECLNNGDGWWPFCRQAVGALILVSYLNWTKEISWLWKNVIGNAFNLQYRRKREASLFIHETFSTCHSLHAEYIFLVELLQRYQMFRVGFFLE